MRRRELLPAALVLLAVLSDAAGASSLAFYLLLASVPAIVVAGLASLEESVQPGVLPHRRVIGMLHVVTLILVLVASALRAPLRAEGSVPRAAVSAVVACLVVFAVQALVGVLPAVRRRLLRRAWLGGVPVFGLEAPAGQFLGDEALAEPRKR